MRQLLFLPIVFIGCTEPVLSGSEPFEIESGDGCAAYYEHVSPDAEVLYDPCDPRPVKPRRDGGAP